MRKIRLFRAGIIFNNFSTDKACLVSWNLNYQNNDLRERGDLREVGERSDLSDRSERRDLSDLRERGN